MATIFNDEELDGLVNDEEILTLGWYFPTKGEHKPYFSADDFSKAILDIKSDLLHEMVPWKKTKISQSHTFFKNLVKPLLGSDTVIAVVPSSDPTKEWHGITRFIQFLVRNEPGLTDGHALLVRTRKINKLAEGGDRARTIHEETLHISHPEDVAGKQVLILDDITSTRHSLEVAIAKFKAAGATKVVCLALGKTAPAAKYIDDETDCPSPIQTSPAQQRLNTLITHAKVVANRRQFESFRKTAPAATMPAGFSYASALPAGQHFARISSTSSAPAASLAVVSKSSSTSTSSGTDALRRHT